MKAIILAAGKSTRLHPLTLKTPKCLLEIDDGLTILEFQIHLLNELNINDILVVTGFESQKIIDKVKDKARFAYYPDYSKSNNLHTLNFVNRELNDDIIIMFADVVLSIGLLEKSMRSLDDYNLIIDDNDISDKTMRVKINDKSIYDIGSHIPVSEGDANFIGVAKYSKSGALKLQSSISHLCKLKEHINDYYTIALKEIYKTNAQIKFTKTDEKYYWNEIDYLDDYNDVKNNYKSLKGKLFGKNK